MTVTTIVEVEEFVRKFEKVFSLFSLVSSVVSNGVVQKNSWFIDNGASRHMTRIWHILCEIIEIYLD